MEFLRSILKYLCRYFAFGLAVDAKDDFLDSNFGESLDHVLYGCFSDEGEDGFGAVEGEGSHSGAIAADKDDGFHF